MSGKAKTYKFLSPVWKYKGAGGWHFVTLPKSLSKKIRQNHGLSEEGWGRLKTMARIGGTEWRTAIWFDTKTQSYLLPVKATIRNKERLEDGSKARVVLSIRPEDSRLSKLLGRR